MMSHKPAAMPPMVSSCDQPFLILLNSLDLTNANELTELVQNMLNQMQKRFQGMSDNIVDRIDDMGGRIEELEKSIGELVNEAGALDENNPDAVALAQPPISNVPNVDNF